ncbi:MAG: hypothetical protein DRM99_03510 [Thermoplasmata archaeon]|nr:MAG: hypothetical protein DRM99_03510 [Thermoplasmata archaeon]
MIKIFMKKRVILLLILLGIFFVYGCMSVQERYCFYQGTNERMSLSEARIIAENSECMQEGPLKNTSMCNAITGTWWIDLDVQKENCNPACVVNILTKNATINWRCRGLVK